MLLLLKVFDRKGTRNKISLSYSWILQLILLSVNLFISGISSQWTQEVHNPFQVYPTVNKCCPLHQSYNNGKCEETEVTMKEQYWSPPKYILFDNLTTPEVTDNPVVFRFIVLLNGSLVTSQDNHEVLVSNDKFCIDGTLNDGPWGHSGHESDQIVLICHPNEEEGEEKAPRWIFTLYASVMFASTFFLILTASVYLILWECQTIHGWLQFSYVVSLLFAYSFLASVQLLADYIHEGSPQVCEIIGVIIHFSFLSAFFWLSSMNFDLWWTFSGCRPLRAATRTGEKARFAFFGLLSWGGAILIASTGLALDTIYKGDESDISEYLPKFGKQSCYFHNERSRIPFFYAPVGILFCLNFVFFLSTICSLHKLQRDTRFATRQSSKQDKKRFVLFMKLFIVMGVCWSFEVISGISSVCLPEQKVRLRTVFLFTDILNALQGFFIFLIFTYSTVESSVKEKVSRCFIIGFCAVILPGVHGLRKLFSYCGRPTRTLDGRRNTSHNTVTSTFEKSRKASDSSACTTLSVIDAGGTYEMY